MKYNILAFRMFSNALILIILFLIAPSSSNRVKRVVNGVIVHGRNTGYDAVRYFAAFGTFHGFSLSAFFQKGPLYNGEVSCGGALITNAIVQTACHCVSEWETEPTKFIRSPIIDNHWEGVKVVYVGVNDQFGEWSMETTTPISSQKFFVHQKCGQFKNLMMTHDYGWIKVDPAWIFRDPFHTVSYAPQYSKRTLGLIWDYNLKRQAMCLHLGFGITTVGDPKQSDPLLHGWGVLMAAEACSNYRIHGIIGEDIDEYMNFFCSSSFSKHDQPIGPGDSGGPISCNNFYYGVVSGAAYNIRLSPGNADISLGGGIVFAPFENAADYRKDFIAVVDKLGEFSYQELVKRHESRNRAFRSDLQHKRRKKYRSCCRSNDLNFVSMATSFILIVSLGS